MAAVTLNATGTAQLYATNTASPLTDTSLTIAAGSDRYLVVCLASRNGTLPGLSVTWNSVSLTVLNSQTEATWGNTVYILGLAAPATGNQTLSVSWTGGASQRVAFRSVCLNNVGSVSGTLTNGSGNSANAQGNITTVSGDATVSVHAATAAVTAVTHTSLWTSSVQSSSQYNLSTTTADTHQYTHTSDNWALAGVRLLQTGAGGSGNGYYYQANQ